MLGEYLWIVIVLKLYYTQCDEMVYGSPRLRIVVYTIEMRAGIGYFQKRYTASDSFQTIRFDFIFSYEQTLLSCLRVLWLLSARRLLHAIESNVVD